MSVLEGTWQHEYIISNGLRLHYVTQGEGPLMLMLHGFPEFWYSWRHQIPEFAKDYKVVALDLRGYNDSDKPKAQSAYVMAEFIKDIEGVIKGLGYDKCILVGHDWGGAIAWSFAYAHPEMVERLIVLNIPHPAKFAEGFRTPQQLLKSSYMFLFQLPVLPEMLLQAGDYQAIENGLKGMAVNKSAFTPADIEAYKDAAAKRGALTAALNYYRNMLQQGMTNPNWGVLNVPTLMIWGEKDTALGRELSYGTATYVNPFQVRYIPDASHWVQQEKPELVNEYMREFLSS
ncbi:MAG: Soluble epoxide hydrolase [Chroococcidiopsis cubana SAG 39.79]|jgi:epoxide hydrolase 4|uniref:Alpha/beta hydrolase fold protein n=2 Tax=Chroococcidiopsis TaxID=54298 RepID=K9U348_CHRTP|nr:MULTISPECIES: alpha/beta hydrolase [Chroococcidiopsis]MBE9018688.1 alpha/beta hydrolase [Chroococcidiopsidales cyanobacterium LEGE 13417]PSB47619.1 alpha/beta hydrolase [Cyanosarcina cf. burmensis CCALA 770]AFY89517.1 alpha/beta hydrolase fold protein [Chroococcidiopsis thermalis PCC 7203]MDZ4878714.1 Soluble epoxide hydrolase [Chroococcidiopsis cubana SAG 39.79]PSB61035.1 alpha/beta hydrolase [Chroococcidiopsis cubana CCALA 043]